LFVATLMLRAAYGLLKNSGRVLLEMAPEQLSVQEIGDTLAGHPHLASVHDLHVWEIGSAFPSLSTHVLVHKGDDCHAIRLQLERLLQRTSASTVRRSKSITNRANSCRSVHIARTPPTSSQRGAQP
jgi:cobalt-zinc-cadmium efflux system protein